MKKIYYDTLYLTACAVNAVKPAERCLVAYREEPEKLEELYRSSHAHYLDTLVGMAFQETGITLPGQWRESMAKSVRKELLFDAERAGILAFMERSGIWYLPLKGCVLKDLYPGTGTRQMSDNDILFDAAYADTVKKYMVSQGYEAVAFGQGVHDVYYKPPVCNFEMHRALYGDAQQLGWVEYYAGIKERLILTEGSLYGYHMRDEDFYVYIVSHAYKHYRAEGTGLRTLLDFYLYLREKKEKMNFGYVQHECKALGITDFEEVSRRLSQMLFSRETALEYAQDFFECRLSKRELEMLQYCVNSGVYGNFEQKIQNRMKRYKDENGAFSKRRYYLKRLFPEMKFYQNYYPFFYRHKYLLPVGWFYRLLRRIFAKRRREEMLYEIHTVQKSKET